MFIVLYNAFFYGNFYNVMQLTVNKYSLNIKSEQWNDYLILVYFVEIKSVSIIIILLQSTLLERRFWNVFVI